MSSRLYVSNLSQAATLASLRALFGRCGEVLEVEFAAERGSHRPPSAAMVTMATAAAAEKALQDLHGRLHCDRVLMIGPGGGAPDRSWQEPERNRARAGAPEVKAKLTQQYRDRHGLTYELDCSGKRLTLRVLFPTEDTRVWQLEARMDAQPTAVATGAAPTREQAFRVMVDDWASVAHSLSPAELDWEQVALALRAVKALDAGM